MGKRGPLPPLTGTDFVRMLRFDGWVEERGGSHRNWTHPTKPGTVQISDKWSGVKTSHFTFKGVLAQTGWSKKEATEIYWRSRGL